MQQIVIRVINGAPGVLDVLYGRIIDGQFQVRPFDECPGAYAGLVCVDSLLGTSAYLRASDLTSVVSAVLRDGGGLAFYPGFLTLNLPDYESEKEKNA